MRTSDLPDSSTDDRAMPEGGSYFPKSSLLARNPSNVRPNARDTAKRKLKNEL